MFLHSSIKSSLILVDVIDNISHSIISILFISINSKDVIVIGRRIKYIIIGVKFNKFIEYRYYYNSGATAQ